MVHATDLAAADRFTFCLPASIVLSQVVNDRTADPPVAATRLLVVAKTASTPEPVTVPTLSRPREPSIEESFFLQHRG